MNVEFREQMPSDVEVVQSMGSDLMIYRAARISYGADDEPTQERLKEFIGNLLAKGHGVPFEHCSITYRLKAPIFVFRQLFRYRTAAISEKSMRYTEARAEIYMPQHIAVHCPELYEDYIFNSLKSYMMLMKSGVSKEQARAVLPLATFSEAYFTMNLRNLFHLFDQRCDEHAQAETRFIAERMAEEAAKLFPVAMECWREKR